MAKPRLQVETIPERALQPAASPVDTFERTDAGRDVEALARGLAALEPGLSALSGTLTKQTSEKQFAAGQQKAREATENGLEVGKAVREGRLPASGSKWFKAGLKEQLGRLAADNWQSSLTAAVAQDESLQTSTELSDFDAFAQEHLKEWSKENSLETVSGDPQFVQGFGHKVDAYMADARRSFAANIGPRMVKQALEGHFSEVMGIITKEIGRNTPPEQIVKAIADRSDMAVKLGSNGRQVNLTTVKAAIQAAWEIAQTGQNGDELKAMEVLNFLDQLPGGAPGSTLARTSYGAPLIQEARQNIAGALSLRAEREHRQVEQARETSTRKTLGSVIQRLATATDASTVDLRQDILSLSEDPTAVASLQSLQNNVVSLQNRTNEGVAEDLLGRIWVPDGRAPVTERTLVTLLNQGQLSRQDAAWLQAQMDQERQSHNRGPEYSLLHEEWYENAYSNLGGRFGSMVPDMGDRGDRKANAQATLTSKWIAWRNGAGATSSTQERVKWLSDMSDFLAKKYRVGLPNSPFTSPKADVTGTQEKPVWETAPMPGMDTTRIRTITREISSGTLSLGTRQLMQQYGLTVPQLAGFLESQTALLTKTSSTTGGP